MDTVISAVVTVLSVVGMLVAVLVAMSTGMFTARVPTGPDAMGLAGPMLAGVVGILATAAGAWLCVGKGGFDWVSGRPLVPLSVVTVVVLGVSLAWAWGFMAWGEKWAGPWASLAAGLASPLLLQGLVVWCAWSGSEAARGLWGPRAVGLALMPAVAGGLVFGAWCVQSHVRGVLEREAQEAAEARARDEEWTRREGLTRVERVKEDLEKMSAGAPFWSVSMMLVGEEDEEARRLIVARARRVRDFEGELKGTATCSYATLRGGAVEFMIRDEGREAGWSGLVAGAMKLLAEDIRRAGALVTAEREDDLGAEAVRLAAAARVFGKAGGAEGEAEMAGAIEELRAAVASTPAGEARARVEAALGG